MANSLLHAAIPFPIYGALYTVAVPFLDATGAPVDPSSPDTEVSLDGGATFSDCTNEITTGGGNGVGYITLTAAEMTGYVVILAAKSANAKTTILTIYPRPFISLGGITVLAAINATSFTVTANDVDAMLGNSNHMEGLWVLFTSGAAIGQARVITAYNVTGTITIGPALETQPASPDDFQIGFPMGAGPTRQMVLSLGGSVR